MAAISPLTIQQESMLLLNKMAPDGIGYNHFVGFTVRPGISVEQLQRGMDTLLARHDLLRSTFHADHTGTRRLTSRYAVIEPEVIDGTTLDAEQTRELAQQFGYRHFTLGEQLPLRCLLIDRGQAESVVVLVTHHIASDFHSIGVFVADLFTSALEPDRELPPVEHSFTDHVHAERQWLNSDEAASARDHWLSLLDGVDPVLELPADLPRPAEYRLVGGTVDFRLPDPLVTELKTVCRECGVTPFCYLLAAFVVLLQRGSGRREFVIGSGIGTRGRRSAHVTGPFVNTMPIKAAPAADLTVAELGTALAEQITRSAEHARYPFALLPSGLGIPRDPSRTPLVQVLMTLMAVGRSNPVLAAIAEGAGRVVIGDHQLEHLDLRHQEGQFDLGLEIYQTPQTIRGRLKFNSEIFTRATVERMARHYTTLIDAAVHHPGELIDRLSMVDQEEKASLLAFSSGE
ncbi:condensation domain-containing protein [Nocardia sp. NPDC046473]|uniref:condensation domain-containing protein n=1 Tax=Nocardia sp. NPDC046473 TaxID=3155733 RepID=UPI0033E421E2